MLSKITWGELLTGITLMAFLYYLIIGVKYREYFKGLLKSKLNKKTDNGIAAELGDAKASKDSFEELENVTRDLDQAVFSRTKSDTDKLTLLFNLQKRLNHYEGIHKDAFRYALNNYIISATKKCSDIQFTNEELNAAWEELPSDDF